jgi:hypothetical protein
MSERYLCLTDAEAALAAKGELRAIVRANRNPPPEGYDRHCWYSAPIYGWTPDPSPCSNTWHKARSPFAPGDRIGLKESWSLYLRGADNDNGFVRLIKYAEDNAELAVPPEYWAWFDVAEHTGWMKRSPVTMPRFAIRHRFTVKESRACMAKDIKAGILLDTVGHSWQKLYEKYSETDWIWYAEVEKS